MNKIMSFSFLLLTLVTTVTSNAKTITVERPDGQLPPAQLGISPPTIDKSLKMGVQTAINQSVTFYNYNSKSKEVSVKLIDVDGDKKQIEPSKKTLAPWTILNPTKFTIPGNGQQTIRLSIRPPVGFPAKKHHAILLIQQQVKDSVTKNADGVLLKFGSSYALPVTITINNDSVKTDSVKE